MIFPYLEQFESFAKRNPGPIPHSVSFDFGKHQKHIVFGSLVHGNETGSLPAVLKILDQLQNKSFLYHGRVTFFLGNQKAALQEKRFLEKDLNRCFSDPPHLATASFEIQRAQEIKKLLAHSDVLVDFHQTNRPCPEGFYIFALHPASYFWARAIGVCRILITRKQQWAFSPEGMCIDEYMHSLQKPGITLELGERGLRKDCTEHCLRAIQKSLQCLDNLALFTNKSSERRLKNLACKNQDFIFLEKKYHEKFSHPQKRLFKNLSNLQKVTPQQPLGLDEKGTLFYPPQEGFLLFPQYPQRDAHGASTEPLPSFLYTLVGPLKNPKKLIS